MYGPDLTYVHHRGFSDFARAAAPAIVALLRGAGIDRGVVTDLGCGSGILASELVAHGYEVRGYDLSPEMIALARREVPQARFEVASLHDLILPPSAAITAIGEPFTYATGGDRETTLRRLFERCAAALPAGGMLLFDVVEHVNGEAMSDRNWSAEGDDWLLAVNVSEDREARLLTRSLWIYRANGEHSVRTTEVHRAWTVGRQEVSGWLAEACFTVRFGGWPLPPRRLAICATKS